MTPGPGSAGRVELLADDDRPGGWLVLVDDVRQSYVDLGDPTYLDFDYVQAFADVVAALPPGPLAVTHVGGGACTLARWLAVVRPGSPQVVLEPNAELTARMRAVLPLPRGHRIRIRPVDGLTGTAALADASADVVVLDAYDDGRVPAELVTPTYLADVARVLRPGGTFLANLADGPPLTYVHRVAATVRAVLPELVAVADPAVLKRRRFGNVVLAASRAPLPVDALERACARAALPRRVDPAVGRSAAPLAPGELLRAPDPPDDVWRIR